MKIKLKYNVKEFNFTYDFKTEETAHIASEALIGYLLGTHFRVNAKVDFLCVEKDSSITRLSLKYVSVNDLSSILNRICNFYDEYRTGLNLDFDEEWEGL